MWSLELNCNTFHSSTDSGRIPQILAGIQEFCRIPGIPEDSSWNQQESNWNRQIICFFRLYLLNLLLIYAYQDPYTLTYVI